ncbi:MAG TPA: NAD(P)/FAD-dependent oxidoreductase [Thermoplasmata archaeon]|nr:NAD(P)/FAD-dependent oxidoreductase [Thermoplasmata archaeon]
MDAHDVVVIGGGFAGLSAAIYLARARRPVVVIDSGAPRNRFSSHSHGVFALDGRSGHDLLTTARSQLLTYPSASVIDAVARRVSPSGGDRGFGVEIEDGRPFEARRLILATGLVDEVPEIPGIAERWGRSVFHCPYCDGYEVGGGPVGVIATLPLSVHFAELLADWGSVTLYTNGAIQPDESERKRLAARGVAVEDRPVAGLEGSPEGSLGFVRLVDGSRVEAKALFVATRYRQAAPFAEQLGCALEENPRGLLVRTDESKMTSVRGVYAAGDMARATHSIPFATADGVTAGVAAHQSLVVEPRP